MKVKVNTIFSSDVSDLKLFIPDKHDNFGFSLTLNIGVAGDEAGDLFEMYVCTPKWLSDTLTKDAVFFGYQYIIVRSYNYDLLLKSINRVVENCSGETWEEIAVKLNRYGRWEFDEYKDFEPQ